MLKKHLITFKSGRNRSVIDYTAITRDNLVKNCMVVQRESIAPYHILLRVDFAVKRKREKRRKRKRSELQSSVKVVFHDFP